MSQFPQANRAEHSKPGILQRLLRFPLALGALPCTV